MTVIGITSPILNSPSDTVVATDAIVGVTPSTTNALFAPSEFAAPGAAKVKVDVLLAASKIVPLFKASASVPA